ncbi:kinase-like domain-containing protein [Syncephalis fuscata]|nr:kinase-like domain-containing protein [Syncephalis fuscata]
MDMSDSPLFSSGGTGPSTSEMFGHPPGINSHFSFSRSADLMAQSSELAHAGVTRLDSEFHSFHVVNSTEMTQEIDMDDAVTTLDSQAEEPPAWGILQTANNKYPTIYMTKEDTPGGKQGGYLLGRHRECDVIFESSLISNRHCLIYKVNERRHNPSFEEQGRERVFVEDLSSNGTFVNGVKIGRGNRRELVHGDELQLAIWTAGSEIPYFYDKFYIFQQPPSHRNTQKFKDLYVIHSVLGSGAFATVKLALERRTGQSVAVKIMDRRALYKRGQMNDQIDQETRILMALDHPCIVKINEVFNEEQFYMVLEFLPGGELFERIKKHGCFNELEARIIFLQLFHAIKYLHRRDITHRDLKPENILMYDSSSLRLKVSDFGLAKMVSEETFLHTLCGTPSYVAPEVFNNNSQRAYTKAVDMWSCGVILYVCLSGQVPFNAMRSPPTLKEQIQQGLYNFDGPAWAHISESAKDLIEWLLATNPEERATIDNALAHPWMQETDLSIGGLDGALLVELRESLENTRSLRREPTVIANEDFANYNSLTLQFNNLNPNVPNNSFVTPSQSFLGTSDGVEGVGPHAFNGMTSEAGRVDHGSMKRGQFAPFAEPPRDVPGQPTAPTSSKRPRVVQGTWKH